MAKKVFISFRFSDGEKLKSDLVEKLEKQDLIVDKSESKDRSGMTEETIKKYLYEKLADSSITIVLLTPNAITYNKNHSVIDDWLYDELKYSLDDRAGNKTNGVIAIYTEEAKNKLINDSDGTKAIKYFENLVRKNMFNVKAKYKKSQETDSWDSNYDHYISLISLNDFLSNPKKYIEIAIEKRDNIDKYDICKRM